ncbi:MAG: DMT family transporter [Desulfobacterales bacterium]
MYRGQLRWQTVAILLVLAMTWGANMAFIKFAARDLAPLFMAGLRSAVAAGFIFLYMRRRGIPVFPSAVITGHGAVVGLLFALEFGLIYLGLQVTLASRTYLLVYTAPFFVALGAHFFLVGDRLTWGKGIGLGVAFSGVALLFAGNLGAGTGTMLKGDLMALAGGALWAATTLYVKRYLTGRTQPLQAVFFQLFFSAPLLLGLSFALEDPLISGFSVLTGISLFYQCIVVASISFIFWFELVHRYPVSLLHAFTFFVPVFGITVSGVLMLHEVITARLLLALGMVGLGMLLVNHGSGKNLPARLRKSSPRG